MESILNRAEQSFRQGPASFLKRTIVNIPDFSVCGCNDMIINAAASADSIQYQLRLFPEGEKDRSGDIQQAIDSISSQEPDANGFRGILLLAAGDYLIGSDRGFVISKSGVVIRGLSGRDAIGMQQTARLISTSNIPGGTLFTIQPQQRQQPLAKIPIQGDVETGDTWIPVMQAVKQLSVGDSVRVVRCSNQQWIESIGMHAIPKRPNAPAEATVNWKPFELHWDRTIIAVDYANRRVAVDATITTAIEARFGGGYLLKIHTLTTNSDTTIIKQVGIEDVLAECRLSDDSAKWRTHSLPPQGSRCSETRKLLVCEDERHMECVVRFADGCRDCWCRQVESRIFGRHTIISQYAQRITVDRCVYGVPAAPLAGTKRYGFTIAGQLSLVRYCTAYQARHSFAVEARCCGPNVFYQCSAFDEFGSSETHHRWGNGILWDGHRGNVAVQNRQWMGSGHGHSGANCLVWNCEGYVTVQSPPGGAWNFAVGVHGRMQQGRYAFPAPQTDGRGMIWLTEAEMAAIPSLFDYQCSSVSRRNCKH